MNVDHALRNMTQESGRQDVHPAGKDEQIGLPSENPPSEFRVVFLASTPQFPIFAPKKVRRLDAGLARPNESVGGASIRNGAHHVGRQIACGSGIENGLKFSSGTGKED